MIGEGVAQDPFVLAVTELQLNRQAHRQPDKRQVEERHARFHTLSHAGAVDALQLRPSEVVQLVLEQALPQRGLGLPVHLVTAKQLIGAVPAQDHLDAAVADPGEQQPGDNRVDDIAVFGEFGHPDGFADLREADVAWGNLDDLVRRPRDRGSRGGHKTCHRYRESRW